MNDPKVALDRIRAVLAEQRRDAENAARERERAAIEQRELATSHERERQLFAAAVGAVVPLRRAVPQGVARPRPPAIAHQRRRDEVRVLVEAMSDGFDVETLLDTDDALSFRRKGVGIDVVRKLRRGAWSVQAELDLHGLRRDAARDRLGGFLRDSSAAGFRCVRIVHGKGLGSPGREPVLKGKVKSWLMQRAEVLAFTHARPSDGGNGALMVLLDTHERRAVAR